MTKARQCAVLTRQKMTFFSVFDVVLEVKFQAFINLVDIQLILKRFIIVTCYVCYLSKLFWYAMFARLFWYYITVCHMDAIISKKLWSKFHNGLAFFFLD